MIITQYTTFSANGQALREETLIPWNLEKNEARHTEVGVINLYPEITYQEIEGFGGAMTESSAYLLSTLDAETRKAILKRYFGADGLNYRFIRTSIDSCDFGLSQYQAVEDPIADPDFTTFTIDRDRKYIIPMIKEAMAVAARPLSVLLSPWSPPRQWKEPQTVSLNDAAAYGGETAHADGAPSRIMGTLKKEYYGPWGRYMAKYVKAYLDEGIPVTMVTMQNESIAATPWDSCVWTAEDQKVFLRDHLYPAFEELGLTDKVGIFIWDHNKERVYEWSRTMIDEITDKMVAGIAFHWYSGDHFEAVGITRDAFPGKTLMLSECCRGMTKMPEDPWMRENFGVVTQPRADYLDAVAYAHDMIGNLNNGMNRWIDWNLCLNPEGVPRSIPRGCNSPVIIDDGDYRETMILEYIEHFSAFMLPGARRIGMSRCNDKVEAAAAVNADGSIALVLLNRGNKDLAYAVRMNGLIFRIFVPAETISTVMIEQ